MHRYWTGLDKIWAGKVKGISLVLINIWTRALIFYQHRMPGSPAVMFFSSFPPLHPVRASEGGKYLICLLSSPVQTYCEGCFQSTDLSLQLSHVQRKARGVSGWWTSEWALREQLVLGLGSSFLHSLPPTAWACQALEIHRPRPTSSCSTCQRARAGFYLFIF